MEEEKFHAPTVMGDFCSMDRNARSCRVAARAEQGAERVALVEHSVRLWEHGECAQLAVRFADGLYGVLLRLAFGLHEGLRVVAAATTDHVLEDDALAVGDLDTVGDAVEVQERLALHHLQGLGIEVEAIGGVELAEAAALDSDLAHWKN